MKKIAVFIGRFNPVHNGHVKIIQRALSENDIVFVGIGSSFQARTIKNPFSFKEREEMVQSIGGNIICFPLQDYENDTKWITECNREVMKLADRFNCSFQIKLYGYQKDESSWYLKAFPNWKHAFETECIEKLNATDIREAMFTGGDISNVPEAVKQFILDFKKTDDFQNLINEYEYIKSYKQTWSVAPYPPIFVTVDAVVIQSGHILVIKRKYAPGKGLYALPGGFLNQNERLVDAVIRELHEETEVKIPTQVLRGSIKDCKIFDNPIRSLRGRTITHAFLIKLDDTKDLAHVRGADDADKAFWMPLSDVVGDRQDGALWFEDHFQIITSMVGL